MSQNSARLLCGRHYLLKVALTVQLAVIGPVVYVLPTSVPLQPLTELILYPDAGVSVNDVVAP